MQNTDGMSDGILIHSGRWTTALGLIKFVQYYLSTSSKKIFVGFLTSTLLRAQNTTFLSKVWQRFFSNLVAFSENTNFNYLDPLVKQKWSQFRGLYLHINNIVILPNWSENWILIQFSHWSDSPESTRQMEWTLRAKVKNFFQKWKF